MQSTPSNVLNFPKGFLWGASTSSHQIEGGNDNDWTDWEKLNADRLVAKYLSWGDGLPANKILQQEISDPLNYISGMAADHWNLYQKDFQLLKDLNLNAYRLSLEWSRIEPKPGEYNLEALARYNLMLVELRRLGIEPFVTVWHWTFPKWVAASGGFENPDNIQRFRDFSQMVATKLAGVKYWITLNEPEVYSGQSYLSGEWPPNVKSHLRYFKMMWNLTRAHIASRQAIKQANPEAQVGIAKNNSYFQPYQNKWYNRLVAALYNFVGNSLFLDKIAHNLDFIGLNYYFHHVVNIFGKTERVDPLSDLGWEMGPFGLMHTLQHLKRYKVPLYVTENGLADSQDTHREWFIKQSLINVHAAITAGADVRGYFHWSLIDNFEWDKGYWAKFGLYHVDRKTQVRTKRKSADYYAQVARTNQITL
jgi:beta-glucosidase